MERKQIVIIQFDRNMLNVCVDILPHPVNEYSHLLTDTMSVTALGIDKTPDEHSLMEEGLSLDCALRVCQCIVEEGWVEHLWNSDMLT